MTSPMDVDILNVELSDQPTGQVFHEFADLPKELRLQIWETAIPRERLIHISLKVHTGRRYQLAAAEPRYLQRNALRKPISGERYRAVVEGEQLNSKLLRVNREAREVALAFYRVHIPVYLAGSILTERSALLFNPEHDILHIEADAPIKETLIDFLWDLKAYDPKDIGLLKLAVDLDGFCANDLQYLRRSDLFLIRQRTALVETLSQLKEVWFINLQPSKRSLGDISPQEEVAHGVIPLAGGQPSLKRLGSDPRSGLEEVLHRLYVGDIDPRELVFRWRRLLRTWQVEHAEGQVEYRALLATSPTRRRRQWQIKQMDRAVNFLALEEHAIVRGPERPMWPTQGRGEQSGAPAVVGFWLFPIEALGEVGEGKKLADMEFHPGRVLDVREHWPELVVSKLS